MTRDIRAGVCPGCDHDEIIEAHPYEHGPVGFVALAVTHERVNLFGAAGGFDPSKPLGRLRVYVCRRCGLTQWYADRPDEIPVDDEHLTRLIKGPKSAPYR